MYPHGYHHNGFMETPALRMQEVQEVRFMLYNYYI